MSSPNPYRPPDAKHESPGGNVPGPSLNTGRAAYNVVTDVVGGPNVRWKDNVFQAVAISVSAAVGVGIGLVLTEDRAVGAIAGGGTGLLVGLFGSGMFLMIWRAVCHLRGRHD